MNLKDRLIQLIEEIKSSIDNEMIIIDDTVYFGVKFSKEGKKSRRRKRRNVKKKVIGEVIYLNGDKEEYKIKYSDSPLP